MADGRLIIEVYEYTGDSTAAPAFEYIPCSFEKCFKNNKATLKEIIQRGLAHKPDKLKDVIRKVEEAGIDKVEVTYHKQTSHADAYIELTNVVQVTMADADASRKKKNRQNDIILYGKYRLSDGTETTKLRDAQRLSLIYTSGTQNADDFWNLNDDEETEEQKEICLNITYLQM